jgi:proline iminopeptidase
MPRPIPPPREDGYTRSTDVPLYWAKYGNPSGETLLILHGGPGADHCYLLPQMLELGEKYDLLFYDQRGGGRSRGNPQSALDWKTQVDDLARVINEFSLTPLSIVGYSWGGMLALLYLIESFTRPEFPKPARTILIDPAALTRAYRAEFETEFNRRQQSPEVRRMREDLNASGLRERDPAAYRQRAFELSVAGYFQDPSNATDLTPFRVVGRVMSSIWDSLGDYDLLAQLKSVDFPLLIVHGRDDPIPFASSKRAAEALGARLVLLDECGHVPYVEQPGALFRALQAFLTESDPQQSS